MVAHSAVLPHQPTPNRKLAEERIREAGWGSSDLVRIRASNGAPIRSMHHGRRCKLVSKTIARWLKFSLNA